jgi:DNA-directed RNA polymerase subunit RPC12/RpoP
MKYKSFVCAKCGGIVFGDSNVTPRSIIAGQVYHIRCGARLLEEKLEKELKEISK